MTEEETEDSSRNAAGRALLEEASSRNARFPPVKLPTAAEVLVVDRSVSPLTRAQLRAGVG